MDIRNVSLNDLYNLYNDYKQPKQKQITHINSEDKQKFIKKILHILIYPIKINNKFKNTDLKIYKLDFLRTPRIELKNWNVPNGLYLHKICNMLMQKQLIQELNSFFLKTKGKKFFNNEINLVETYKTGINELTTLFKGNKIITELLTNIITNLFYNLYKPYTKKFIDKNILNSIKITLLYYSQKHNIFKGVTHHIDSFKEHQGSISVVTFNSSVLDFNPFIELTENKPFRIMVPKNYAVTFDGNLRYYYTHGVPFNINYDNNYRYALNIRHPDFKDKLELNNNNCNLNEILENSVHYDCVSNIPSESISLI
jgi:hypothetical protein